MRKLLAALIVSLWIPTVALAAKWDNASLIDQKCATKVKDHPDNHPTSCLIKCAEHGYGIQTSDGKYLKLDEGGNKMALAALKATEKKDHIRVNVQGDAKGDVIEVKALEIAN